MDVGSKAESHLSPAVRLVALTLAIAFFVLYRAFPDVQFSRGYDGLILGMVIDGTEPDWSRQLLHPNHILTGPVAMAFHRAAKAAGVVTTGPEALWLMNALLGGVMVAGFFLWLSRVTGRPAAALAGAVGLGLSFGFWHRAAEAMIYMLAFASVWAVYLWVAGRILSGRLIPAVPAAALASGAALVHEVNAAALPAFAWAVWVSYPPNQRRRQVLHFVFVCGMVLVCVYVLAAWNSGVSGWQEAWRWGIGSSLRRPVPGAHILPTMSLSWGHLRDAGLSIVKMLSAGAIQLDPAALGAVGLLAATLWPTLGAVRRPPVSRLAMLSLAFGLPSSIFLILWAPLEHFWTGILLPGWTLAVVLLATGTASRTWGLQCVIGLALLGASNLFAGIKPLTDPANNKHLARTRAIQAHVSSGVIVMSGVGWNEAKGYLPAVARIPRISLDLFLAESPKEEALRRFVREIDWGLQRDVPVYLLSEVEWPETLARLREIWGVEPDEMRAVLARYGRERVATVDSELMLDRLVLRGPSAVRLMDGARQAFENGRLAKALSLAQRAIAAGPDPEPEWLEFLETCRRKVK